MARVIEKKTWAKISPGDVAQAVSEWIEKKTGRKIPDGAVLEVEVESSTEWKMKVVVQKEKSR